MRLESQRMAIRIEPYKIQSKAAKALARRTGILRATDKQVQKHRTFDTVLNWGNSHRRFNDAKYLNNPEAVAIASNKLHSAECLGAAGISQPEYTTCRSIAEDWYDSGSTVCSRTLLNGSGGRGLTINRQRTTSPPSATTSKVRGGAHEHETFNKPADDCVSSRQEPSIVEPAERPPELSDGRRAGNDSGRRVSAIIEAPLYTKYVKKADEYRIHVVDGHVIDIQQKRKRKEILNEDINYQVRNACNGWVFCRDNVTCPTVCLELAVAAVSALSLDFGAVDIGFNTRSKTAVVYEVNTAPGLEGTTLDKYYNAFRQLLPEIGRGVFERRRRQ